MRFESISFDGFGGLSGTRELGPGLNLVVGPNESGKSRLVTGLMLGLCGRVKKRGRAADPFERLRTWSAPNNASFRLQVVLRLANGHRVEVTQNLADPSRSRVVDMDLGRDITPDLLSDRVPDASLLLGLDRDTIPKTLLVHQTDVLAVRDGADAMQSMLQRAATRGAPDETASSALARLDTFKTERIGTEHASSKKPLKMARDRETAARRTLEELRALHQSLGAQQQALIEQRRELAALQLQRDQAKAREVQRELERIERVLQRARQIDLELARLGALATTGAELDPPHLDALDQAIRALESAPVPTRPTTPAPDTLQRELDALPPYPTGDLSPSPELARLHEDQLLAERAEQAHLHERPTEPSPGPTLAPHTLRELAASIEVVPAPLPELPSELAPSSRTLPLIAIALGLLACGLGAGLGVIAVLIAGVLVVALGVAGQVTQSRHGRRHALALAERRAKEADAELARQRRRAAEDALRAARVDPPTSEGARAAAHARELAVDAQRQLDRWLARRAELEARTREARKALDDALAARSASSWPEYVEACNERRRVEAEARRRVDLERLLTTSRAEHAAHETAVAGRMAQVRALRQGATALGLEMSSDAPSLADLERLRAELRRLRERLDAKRTMAALRSELDTLIGDEDLVALEARAAKLRAEATRVSPAPTSGMGTSSLELEARITELQAQVARTEASTEERLRGMPSIAEAEEELELATREHARIRRLERLVGLTIDHLCSARDNVHRDIAPRLSSGLSEVVPRVTAGRWESARITVDTLGVEVLRDRDWRPAHELSCGTAEQIYLALRVVLARELTLPNEPPPLILDDVLVHADEARQAETLAWLDELAATHQVILTSSDRRLLPWAQSVGATVHELSPDGGA